MDATAELGRNSVSKHQIQPEYGDEQADAGRDGTVEPVSRDQILRRERGQKNIHFPCSGDHEQDWQPYPVDPSLAICDEHTYIHPPVLSTCPLHTNSGYGKERRIKNKMPNKWRTIKSLVHKIRLHGRRGRGTAQSFSREKKGMHRRRKVDEKFCVTFLLCDPGWYIQRT